MKKLTGQYVRTKYGIKKITEFICGQDIRFDNTDGFDVSLREFHDYDGIPYNGSAWEDLVIGEPSDDVIDLIKSGDYVNGRKVHLTGYNFQDDYVLYMSDSMHEDFIYPNEIKTIVTKEQFKHLEYEVKGNRMFYIIKVGELYVKSV